MLVFPLDFLTSLTSKTSFVNLLHQKYYAGKSGEKYGYNSTKTTLSSMNSIDIHVALSFTFQRGEHINILNQFSNFKYSLAAVLRILVAQLVSVRAIRKRCYNTLSVLNYSSKHDVRIVCLNCLNCLMSQ